MSWTLGGVTIYVIKDTGDQPRPRIDYINPITTAETTYINTHGRDSHERSITAYCMENYATVMSLVDGLAKALTSPWGAEGDYIIKTIKSERIQDITRDAPVVRVTLDMAKIE